MIPFVLTPHFAKGVPYGQEVPYSPTVGKTKKPWLYTGSGLTQTSVSTRDRSSDLPRKRTL